VAVEAEPSHFDWMNLHFTDNGVDPAQHSLIHAAVCETPGEASFYVASECGDLTPNGWYGQALTRSYEVDAAVEDAPYGKHQVRRHASGAKSITVRAITLKSILDGLGRVDLIDFDLQGHEAAVILAAIDELDRNVARLHIGTHDPEIETELRALLTNHGWRCLADYPSASASPTPWGAIEFQDGVQSWVNPRVKRRWWSRFNFLPVL
jgi:FkbM family methyltransferase